MVSPSRAASRGFRNEPSHHHAGVIVVVVAFAGATLLLNVLWPSSLQEGRPSLASVPPLPPLAGTSTVLTPAAIAMSAIRDALEAQAPRNLSGQSAKSGVAIAAGAELNFTVKRGPLNVTGRPDALVVTTPLYRHVPGPRHHHRRGRQRARRCIGNIIGGNIGQQVQGLTGKAFDQHADIHGTVTALARPTIAPNWRLAPNLTAQVNVVDVALPIAGIKLSVSNEVKPVLDNTGARADRHAGRRVRNDPFIENAARAEWAKLCRAISLGAAAQGVPDLWLEIRPVRAIAAQPKIDANAVTLLVGVQAETRIVPNETKPNCPFPPSSTSCRRPTKARSTSPCRSTFRSPKSAA